MGRRRAAEAVRNRYTTPWLSVLMVQPSRNPNFRNELPPPAFPGICRWVQVVPPSAEDATMIGTGAPFPPVCARNWELQV